MKGFEDVECKREERAECPCATLEGTYNPLKK
jgi:hypothetical protein